ncbi:hypothetical protein MTO96_038107 [Rhipicephalus appendiculatus]
MNQLISFLTPTRPKRKHKALKSLSLLLVLLKKARRRTLPRIRATKKRAKVARSVTPSRVQSALTTGIAEEVAVAEMMEQERNIACVKVKDGQSYKHIIISM